MEGNGGKSSGEPNKQETNAKHKSNKKKRNNGSNAPAHKIKGERSGESQAPEMLGSYLDFLTIDENKEDGDKTVDGNGKTGESFGKGWMKSSFMAGKDLASSSYSATSLGIEAPGSRSKLTFKDFYGDLEDDDDKAKETIANCKSSGSRAISGNPGLQIKSNENKKKLEEETKKTSGDRKVKWGKCSHCQKEGYPLECSRCHLSSYCNQQCQKNDYQLHKVICRRKDTFDKFQAKIPEVIKRSLAKKWGINDVSFLLCDLPTEDGYAFGHRSIVMAEIIGPHYHFFRHGIFIRDMAGEETHILFYLKSNDYLHRVSDKISRRYPLAECLTPGNFILLLDTCWHYFLDMTVGIRINNLDEVHFIFQK